MGKLRKAFTIVELLIVIALFSILGTIISYVIIKSLKSASTSSTSFKTSTSVEINTSILDFDIRHVGYGISKNETSLVLSYCNGTSDLSNPACSLASTYNAQYKKLLLLKETSNVVRSSIPTTGFVLWNGTNIVYAEPSSAASSSYKCIWLDDQKNLLSTSATACSAAPSTNMAIGFPLDTTASCQNPSYPLCCAVQSCTGIAYYLKDSSTKPASCLSGTYVLYRKTPPPTYFSSIFYIPILNCVSDWDVWFGLDTNGDGNIDKWVNDIPNTSLGITTNTDIASELKAIRIYLFVQASYTPDKEFDYCKLTNAYCDSGGCPNGYVRVDVLKDDSGEHYVCLKHPSNPNWVHYRWKTVELIYTSFPNLDTFKSP